jgi:hypothetical protein
LKGIRQIPEIIITRELDTGAPTWREPSHTGIARRPPVPS